MCSALYSQRVTTTYAAHIVSADAEGLGDPEISVMTQDEGGGAEALITYPLPSGFGPDTVLLDNGWAITSDPASTDYFGYTIVDVQPRDWVSIIRAATFNRAAASAEFKRQEAGWRILICDAMIDPTTNKTEIAEVGGVSRERAYQIRDGRR